mmetsp:Transcript_14569/g.38969  ORF Transcript_14569/g.38969 Transcript_14569/m.38969 type:complete len:556 (-) Transcript_14569:171-1838(-)
MKAVVASTFIVIFALLSSSGLAAGSVSATQTLLSDHVARPVAPIRSTESCLKNATHCTCDQKSYRPLIELAMPGMCKLDPTERDGYVCGCPGATLCEILEYPCSESTYVRLRATGVFNAAGQVTCERAMRSDELCRKTVPITTCSSFSNIFIDGEYSGCAKNVQVSSDVDDAYGLRNGSRVTRLEGLELDMINIRVVETTRNDEVHLCVIYGNWLEGEELFSTSTAASRKASVRMTTISPLYVELRDTNSSSGSEQYIDEGMKQLLVSSEYSPAQSEGFCVGPFLNDGSGLRAEFFNLANELGINVQTSERSTNNIQNLAQWKFVDHFATQQLSFDGRADGDESVTVDIQPTCACGTATLEAVPNPQPTETPGACAGVSCPTGFLPDKKNLCACTKPCSNDLDCTTDGICSGSCQPNGFCAAGTVEDACPRGCCKATPGNVPGMLASAICSNGCGRNSCCFENIENGCNSMVAESEMVEVCTALYGAERPCDADSDCGINGSCINVTVGKIRTKLCSAQCDSSRPCEAGYECTLFTKSYDPPLSFCVKEGFTTSP